MARLILALILASASLTWGANDFSGDENCKGLWSQENNQQDGTANGNDLTDQGSIAYSATAKEGTKSGDFEQSDPDYADLADGSLSAGFPGKSSGGSTEVSFCAWVRAEQLPASGNANYIVSKYNSSDGQRSYCLYLFNDSGTLKWNIISGYSGGTGGEIQSLTPTHAPVVNQWYHVAFSIDSSGNFRIQAYDETEEQEDSTTGTFSNGAMSVGTAPFELGGRSNIAVYWDGLIDEAVIFSDKLTGAQMTDIRSGTYSTGEGTAAMGATAVHRGIGQGIGSGVGP